MRYLKLIPHLFSFGCLFISFASNSSITINRYNKTNSRTAGGTIACLIDGKQKTLVIQGFREISLDFYSKSPSDGILFANGDEKVEGFQFKIKKRGITKINHTGTGDAHCIINYYNSEGVTYTGQDVTVVVISYNQNHLTGTFSGRLANVYYKSGSAFPTVRGAKVAKNYPEFIQITNGKFDLEQ
jgi:hypothetical protein